VEEIPAMRAAISPSTQRRYPLTMIWTCPGLVDTAVKGL